MVVALAPNHEDPGMTVNLRLGWTTEWDTVLNFLKIYFMFVNAL